MALIRSAFWLSVAFLAIGPRIDLPGSLSDMAERGSAATQQAVSRQVEQVTCTSLECVGVKIAINAGMQSAGSMIKEQNASGNDINSQSDTQGQAIQNHPVPRPRLMRSG